VHIFFKDMLLRLLQQLTCKPLLPAKTDLGLWWRMGNVIARKVSS